MQHRISIVDQDTVDVYSLVSLKFLNVYDVEILISSPDGSATSAA
jgi:hypothetical protein